MTDPLTDCRNARYSAIQGIRKYLSPNKKTDSKVQSALDLVNNYFNLSKVSSAKAERAVRRATKRCEMNPDKLDANLQILADKAQVAITLASYRKDALVMLKAFKSTSELKHYIRIEDYRPPESGRPAPSGAMI